MLFILSQPIIRDSLYIRYYLESYSNTTINDIYDMYFILFELGITITISERSCDNIVDLIRTYSENEVLMHFIKHPSLRTIIDKIKVFDLNIDDYINDRFGIIEETHTVIFDDQFHYAGITELDDTYRHPPHLDITRLKMIYYTDPLFTELIGPYNLSSDQIQELTDVVQESGLNLVDN